ncbi:hypothetical protein GWI33_007804 [Rhynchophorus ferrugineus]|uniref:Uncharacterized protein n=1 Tax=Rhynchophorus ferrugineus TaxID=354439 RepID=A0A834MI09_RHYFE|nr:hypothetical protein GWI33_007804 [Rhynchophorus ferrugineus]
MKKIYAVLFVVLICIPHDTWAKSKKKNIKGKQGSSEEIPSQPAIIAIEIVDPNENSTSSTNSKRTIENSLGYGYNSFGAGNTKLQVYKYSQHDIPPFKGDSTKLFAPSSGAVNHDISIQKSLQYTLPTITHYEQTNNVLQPGTTLYSTVNEKGQISGLSSSLSEPSGPNKGPIPVIVLRIYPDQLKDSTLQANLPDNHPFAKTINSVNIQSLLSHYINALQNPQILNQYSSSQNFGYSSPSASVNTARPTYYQETAYQNPSNYHNTNNQGVQSYQYYQQSMVPNHVSPALNNRYLPTQSYQPAIEPQEQQYYYQPQAYITKSVQESYPVQETITQYYQPNQQEEYSQQSQEQSLALQQYLLGNNGQYQQYYTSQSYEKNEPLLTHENYPGDKHTKVIFKTKEGGIKTTQNENTQSDAVKTINIRIPENVAKIEVQETERPYYTYDNTQAEESKPSEGLKSYYYLPPTLQNAFGPDAQNYEEMIKYYTRRGILSSQLLQNDEQEHQSQPYAQESKISKAKSTADSSTNDMITAYEETFPISTAAPTKKRVKSKKRIYH